MLGILKNASLIFVAAATIYAPSAMAQSADFLAPATAADSSGGAAAAMETGGQGTQSYTTNVTGTQSSVTAPSALTGTQGSGLGLNPTGTMNLAPVFGTGNDGYTGLGGYSPGAVNNILNAVNSLL